MKAYHVQRDGAVWQVSVTDGTAILQSENRQYLINLTRELAKRRGVQLFVYDSASRLEVVYTYIEGVEHAHRQIMPPLSAD
jgi:hypothetical protein